MIYIWQKAYDFYQKYKNKCFLQDLAINQQLGKIQNSNSYNEDYTLRLAEGTAFKKDSVPTLIAWYDASSGVVKDAGDNVSGWTDLSDGGNHLDTTPAIKPIWYDSVINGKPAVSALVDNVYIRRSGITNFGTSFTAFVVWKPTDIDTGTYQDFIAFSTSALRAAKQTGTTQCNLYNGEHLNGEVLLNNRADIWTMLFNGASSSLRRNGNSAVSGNAGSSFSGDRIELFSMNSTYDSQGYFGEVLVYDDTLSEANQKIVREYLNNKYHLY